MAKHEHEFIGNRCRHCDTPEATCQYCGKGLGIPASAINVQFCDNPAHRDAWVAAHPTEHKYKKGGK